MVGGRKKDIHIGVYIGVRTEEGGRGRKWFISVSIHASIGVSLP